MSFNPKNEFAESIGPEKMERKVPCGKCRNGITILPPVVGYCWACWAGWPAITKPVVDLTKNPHYIATTTRLLLSKFERYMKNTDLAYEVAADMVTKRLVT
jgi:hypothetical protein